jgi:hypothetical protein
LHIYKKGDEEVLELAENNDFDDSKADEALKFIGEIKSLSLDEYRVVGNCVRHDSAARDLLIKIMGDIITLLRSNGAWQENYLIGGLAGSGKTFFVEELGKSIGDFATFEKLKLSDLNRTTFQQKLDRLKEIRGPLLCLVDEVDKKLYEEWPFIALLTPLEKSNEPYRSCPTCFVLVGSGGSEVSKLKQLIGSVKAGDDLLRRVSFKREENILPTSPADRIVVALSNLTEEARISGSVVRRVDKLALLYIALKCELARPSKIASLAQRCIRKKKAFQDVVHYNDLFDSADRELGQFQSKWDHTGLFGSFVYVKDDRPRISGARGVKFEDVFERVEIAFEREMQDNFLRDLKYSTQPDYIRLLLPYLRHLLKSFLNKDDMFLVSGGEGVGKTFNCLLFGKMLASDGYQVFYSSVHKAVSLLADDSAEIADLAYGNHVFIIDDCQEDLEKTRKTLRGIRAFRIKTNDRPKFIFLSHPLDKFDTIQFLGADIQILEFKERYVDLRYLAELFLGSINMYDRLPVFLDWLGKSDTSKAFARYKNMKFWNIYFNTVKKFGKMIANESEFLNNARQFFKDRKPQLIELKDPLAKLLPFFANGRFALTEYVREELQIGEDHIKELEVKGIIDRVSVPWEDENWDNCNAPAIRCRIHPTEAKILEAVLQKCDAMVIDDRKTLIDYSVQYLESLYYIMREIRFYNSALLEDLCEDERFRSIVRNYLKERHLGKQLDRTVRILSKLTQEVRYQFVDDGILNKWIEKLNDPKFHFNSKVALLKAIYRVSPIAAYKCYEKLDMNTLVESFLNIPSVGAGGLSAFKRFIETSKNIWSFYLFSIDPIFEDELNSGGLSDDLRRDFEAAGHALSNSAKIEHVSMIRWEIVDGENTFNVRKPKNEKALIVYYSYDDLRRRVFLVSNTRMILDKCLEEFLRRFDTLHKNFAQLNWLLRYLDGIIFDPGTGMTLAIHVLEKIRPDKMVEWMKSKNTATKQLRYMLETSRHVYVGVDSNGKATFYDRLKGMLDYEEVRRIFENPGSSLKSICITANKAHELFADFLYRYSQEDCFVAKVTAKENQDLYDINRSLKHVEENKGLSLQQKHFIINRIVTISMPNLRRCSMRSEWRAKSLKKGFDTKIEEKEFLGYKDRYPETASFDSVAGNARSI